MTGILLIAYFFPPAGGAGVQRAVKFVEHLPAEGFSPEVITGPTSPDDRWTPHDLSLLEAIGSDVRVHRTREPMPRATGRWRRRLESWLALPSSFSKWWIGSATELGERVGSDQRVILATMSPFESGEVAHRLATRLGLPWVADLRDPWALDEMQVYPSSLHRRLELRRMERLLSGAAAIVMNTPEATSALRAAFPRLRDTPVVTITNGFDESDFAGPAVERRDGKFRIVHSGYLHTDTGLLLRRRRLQRLLGSMRTDVDILTRSHTKLLEALELWTGRRPDARPDLELVLAGRTTAEDREVAARSPLASLVRFPGYLSHDDSVELVRSADLLFLPMHNLPRGERSRIVPGKTYEYMAAGRPILAAVPDGDARDFLASCGTAHLCRPDDVSAMAEALDNVYDAWRRRAPAAQPDAEFLARFERRALARALATTLRSVVGPRPDGVLPAVALETAETGST